MLSNKNYVTINYMLRNQSFDFKSVHGVLDVTLCDKVYQWLATGWWFSLGTLVSSTNKTERYNWNIVESGVKNHKPNQTINKTNQITSYFPPQPS